MKDNISDEEWNALPREERINRLLLFLGSEHNKYMDDAMHLGEYIKGAGLFDFVVKTLLGDFHERMTKYISNFNNACPDVVINDIVFQDIDPIKLTCKVVPKLTLIDD